MLAKEKMEGNKKIHSAVAEERIGEGKEGGTAFKALAADIIGRVHPRGAGVPIERPILPYPPPKYSFSNLKIDTC